MTQPTLLLPSEVWTNVFAYLSPTDKSSVRASCKHFRRLVDHGSLWKDWSVVLDFKHGPYNSRFWASLCRRKVASVVMRSSKDKDWKLLSSSIPVLSTVVMERCPSANSDCLKGFPHLKRLGIRSSCTSLVFNATTVCRPQQLTHLSLCDVKLSAAAKKSFISGISHFTNLVSLVCHQTGVFEEPFCMLNSLRRHLPKLKHLSLSVPNSLYAPPSPRFGLPAGAQGPAGGPLSSFELVGALDHLLPVDAMTMMPQLKSLAVFYRLSSQEVPETRCFSGSCMEAWLGELRQLSTLIIVKGPNVRSYVSSIPATVTSLTLCVAGLSSEDLAAVALQVPNLLHLHIDPWPSHLGAHTAQIPRLFPKLRTLKLRHEHVPEKNFLDLHRLQDLETLEVLDSHPHLSELTEKLRALTGYRLQVIRSPRHREVMSCPCVSRAY